MVARPSCATLSVSHRFIRAFRPDTQLDLLLTGLRARNHGVQSKSGRNGRARIAETLQFDAIACGPWWAQPGQAAANQHTTGLRYATRETLERPASVATFAASPLFCRRETNIGGVSLIVTTLTAHGRMPVSLCSILFQRHLWVLGVWSQITSTG